jgi:hypothetical protein
MISIDQSLRDPLLLGAALGDSSTWSTWQTVLKAAFALPLSESDCATFKAISGNRAVLEKPSREIWAVCGRGSGKSRMSAAISVYVACFVDHRGKLAKGETGHILTLSPSLDQSKVIFDYCYAFLDESPILRQKIVSANATEIRLENNIVIATHTNSFRTIRGRSLLCCVFDESAFWRSDESATPDTEVYRAVLPSLARTNGMLIGISSPYRRVGLLYQKHRDNYGVDGDVLVVQGGTELFNPIIDRKIIDQARKDDPAAAAAEWDAQFRSDLSQFVSDEAIDAAVNHARPLELPPQPSIRYSAFVDASAGRHDHFTFCVGHKEGDGFVCDVLRGRKPPFDPASVAKEYAELAKQYKVFTIVGDAYAGEWTAAAFKKCGIGYRRSKHPRSVLYLESMPAFVRGAVSIPDHARLLRELRLLERRTSPGGKDTIDHGKNGSDDYSNALCGCIAITLKEQRDIEVMQPIGTQPAKLFDLVSGVQINRDHPPLPGPEGPNAEAQKASIRTQAAELAPPRVSDYSLSPEARARLEKFKQDQKQESLYTIFCGKCFGAR